VKGADNVEDQSFVETDRVQYSGTIESCNSDTSPLWKQIECNIPAQLEDVFSTATHRQQF
jgi:hypothetical protein